MKLKSLFFGILVLLTAHSVAAQTPTPGPYATMCQTCTAQLAVTAAAGHVALPSTNTAYSALTLYNAGTKDLFWTLGDTTTNATVSNNRLPAGVSHVVFVNGNTFVSAITGGSDTSTLDVFQANGPLSLLVPGSGSGGGGTSPGGATTQVQFNSSGVFAGDAGLTYAGTGRLTITNSTANTTPLTITGGSITGSSTVSPGITIAATTNTTGAVPGALVFGNITNTAMGAGSTLMDLRVNNTSMWKLSGDTTTVGSLTFNNSGNKLVLGNDAELVNVASSRGAGLVADLAYTTGIFSIGQSAGTTVGSVDNAIGRLGAGRIGLSNKTNSTEFDAFSTTDSATSPTNSGYAYLKAGATAGEFDLGSTHTGTGTALTKFGLQVDGTLKADYNITNSGSWTFSNVTSTMINTANINNGLATITAFTFANGTSNADFYPGQTAPMLQFAGTTSSFPAIKRSGAVLGFRLADDSADAAITAGAATLSGSLTAGSLANGTGLASDHALNSRSASALTAGTAMTAFGVNTASGGATTFSIAGTKGNASSTVAWGISSDGSLIYQGLGYAVGSLPSPALTGIYRGFVNNQLTSCAAVGTPPTGGGSVVCPVYWNGTAWQTGEIANDNMKDAA